jgi:hypothetical protein
MEINDQLDAPAALTPDTTQYESERSAEVKSPSPPAEIRTPNRQALFLITIPTELSM